MQRKRSFSVFEDNPFVKAVYPATMWSYFKLRNKIDVYIDLKNKVNIRQLIAYRLLNPKKVTGTLRAFKYGLKNEDFAYFKDFIAHPAEHAPSIQSRDVALNDGFYAFDIKRDPIKYDLPHRPQDLAFANSYWKPGKTRVIFNIFATNKILDVKEITRVMRNIQKDFPNLDILAPFDYKNKKDAAALCASIPNARLRLQCNYLRW